MRFALWALLALSLIGCTTGHCRGRNDLIHKKAFVYKPDGSRQCEKKPGIPVDKMATELNGIEIFSKENRHDGKMHITLCGSPTGRINLYEIKSADLDRAKALGFLEFKKEE